MTLDPSSTLGRALPCLVGAGGAELAFAATRSLSSRLRCTRACSRRSAAPTRRGRQPAASARPAARRSACRARPTRRRSSSAAAASSGRGGSLRADADGVGQDADAWLRDRAVPPRAAGTAFACDWRRPVVRRRSRSGGGRQPGAGGRRRRLDAPSSSTAAAAQPISAAMNVALPPRQDLAAVFAALPALQRLIISIATRKVDRVGEPIRSTKITREAS